MSAILAFFLAWPVIIIICTILSIAYVVATEKDLHAFAITSTIIAGIIYAKPLWLFVAASWQLVLLGILAYAIAGGAWSVFRWFRYCRKYIEEHPYPYVNDSEKYEYEAGEKVMISPAQYYTKKLRPREHKSRLIGWIAYWPWSFVWNCVGDFLTGIYDALANVYQKTTDAVIKKSLGNFGSYSDKN